MSEFMEVGEGPIIEYSEEIFSVFTPSKQLMQRKTRSILGDAIRIRTPGRSKVPCSPNVADKENLFEYANKCISTPLSTRKPPTPVRTINLSAKKAPVTPIRKFSSLDDCAGSSCLLEKDRSSGASTNLAVDEEDSSSRLWKVNDFTLGKPLGRGKFGNVYYAKQKSTNIPIALKVLFKSQINHEQIIKMLKREIEIQYRLKHSNINQLYSYFHDHKNIYLILEYAEQGEFYKYLSKNRLLITEEHCKNFLYQITKAIDYMHDRNVYHRDIKPENILMGYKDKLLLADFGSAVHAPPPLHRTRYTVCGTPEYLSPEMILGSGHDSSLDIWSLGILMYEILYGRTPFSQGQSDNDTNGVSSNGGGDVNNVNMLNNDEVQNLHRQKMYEKIITYKDQLIFERRKHRSSSILTTTETLVDNWKEPSEEAKEVLHQLIKYNKADRWTSKQLLQSSWLHTPEDC